VQVCQRFRGLWTITAFSPGLRLKMDSFASSKFSFEIYKKITEAKSQVC
jgi:hypothetical protein